MKLFINKLLFILIYMLFDHLPLSIGQYIKCPLYQQHFEKIIGYRPPSISLTGLNLIKRTAQPNGLPVAINRECWSICKNDINCAGYVLFYNTSECYGFTRNDRNPRYEPLHDHEGLRADADAVYFEKICLDIPAQCKSKLWPVLRVPGNVLIEKGYLTLRQLMTRRQCIERCLNEMSFTCLSAVFRLSQKNIHTRHEDRMLYGEKSEMGMCILSREDKTTQASSYRVADTDVEYIENQCVERSKASSYCSYEHYEHSTLAYPELELKNVDEIKCQEMCSIEMSFICNGYSYSSSKKSSSSCVLHSEDLISLGPRSQLYHKGYEYMRRVECLNVTVSCENDEMQITYTPKPYFNGKMYSVQHSSMSNCSVDGKGTMPTVLKLKVGDEVSETGCGIQRALQSPDIWKKYLLTTNILIQSNPLVQTQGDRIVRVGCIFSTQPTVAGNPPDLPLNSSIAVAPNEPDMGSDFVNRTNRELPIVDLQIIDLDAHLTTGSVQLGQNLELRINVRPISSPFDIHAFNLVAKSDSGHILTLINQEGCPQNVKIFPELRKVDNGQQRYLYSRFHAFKFPDSAAVNFDVVIHFCPRQCPPVNCDANTQSYGKRKKRATLQRRRRIVDPNYNYFGNMQPYQYTTPGNPTPSTVCFLVLSPQPTLQSIVYPTTTTPAPTTTTPDPTTQMPLGTIIFPGVVSRSKRAAELAQDSKKQYEYKVETDGQKSRSKKQLEESAQVEQTTRGNFTDNQRVLVVDSTEIPLQIKLKVFTSKNASDADRILYGDNSAILVAGLDDANHDKICFNESLLIAILIFWCIFQVILLTCCFCAIKKYKKYLEMTEDKRVLHRINQRLEYERRVHWADQNAPNHVDH